MEALERLNEYVTFLDRLKSASRRVLLLDYDGTLAPFSIDRDHAFPYPEVPALLARIMAQGTRVILISGRPARDLIPLSGIHPHPEIWGSHGMERLKPDGTYEVATLPGEQHEALTRATNCVQSKGLERRMELKPGGVAVHWRDLSPLETGELKATILELWRPLLAEYRLKLMEFDGGLELRVRGWNKGIAVETILEESGPDAAVAYLGDDATDEDAFRALKGRGLAVLVRPQSRPSSADVWLKPPEELMRFFQEWLRDTGGTQ
jgi:trehalose 6-phosphate phosphatase